jgi:DNA-binding response OmpR family regulator
VRVLVIEDEQKIASFIKRGLEEKAYAVDVAHDGLQGYSWAQSFEYDFIILDVMLPKMDGFELCRRLRSEGKMANILMLTAKDGIEDRVNGLDAGADDYLVKPFAFQELLARLRALRRRADGQQRIPTIQVADLTLNLLTHQAIRGGQVIELSAKEFSILELFMRHPNQVLTRDVIAEHAWSYDFYKQSNVVDVFIRYIRRKIDDPFKVKLLQTIRGSGYRLVDPNHV